MLLLKEMAIPGIEIMFKRVHRLVLASSCLLLLQSCSDSSPSSDFTSAMNRYSKELVGKSKASISNPTPPRMTSDLPSYIVEYTIVADALMTKKDGDKNTSSFALNTGITAVWSSTFCTQKLKDLMSEYGVKMVTGQLVSKDGEKHSMSTCMN